MKKYFILEFVLVICLRLLEFVLDSPEVIRSGSSLKPQTRATGCAMFYCAELNTNVVNLFNPWQLFLF